MYEIRNMKNSLRAEYTEKRRSLPKELREARDAAVCRKIVALTSYRYADTLLAYAPTDDEIDITPVIKDALLKGKTVGFPLCHPEGPTMSYHAVKDLSELSEGTFGLLEPSYGSPEIRGDGEGAICIIPALVYDKNGYRVGYGKGYYDRYLSGFRGIKAGVVYSDFILENVPHGRFDLAADIIITEKGVRSFAKA